MRAFNDGAADAARPSMSRTTSLCIAAAVVVLGAACARQPGTGTTTVTSGSTAGMGGTGARTAADQASLRLADEICNRQVACSQVGDGARYHTVEACMADQGTRTPGQLTHWSCTPSATQGSFETCLAAIRSEHCETKLSSIDELVACRSNAVCGQ